MVVQKVTPLLIQTPQETWAWVQVTTDTGLTGWGEFSGNPISDQAVSAIIQVVGAHMEGKDPLDPGQCLSLLQGWRYPSFLDFRYAVMAMSALDMALWDIRAKREDVPLGKLLYPRRSRQMEIPLYANLNRLLRKDRSLDKLRASARTAREAGFELVKIAPFDEVTPLVEKPEIGKGLQRLYAAAEEAGMDHLALDCHCRFTLQTFPLLLEGLGEALKEILFLEDPVRIHWGKDLRPIWEARPELAYATGEDCFRHEELLDLAASGCAAILNPDLKYIGGVTGAKDLFPLLSGKGVHLSIHNPSGPVATACSAHAASCLIEEPIEFAWGGTALRNEAYGGEEPVAGGVYHLPDRPGIGFEPAPEFLEKYAR